MNDNVKIFVVFNIYHYNTGSANNGTHEVQVSFPFEKEDKAYQFKRIIDRAFKASEEEKYDTFTYNIGIKILEKRMLSGYITSKACIYSVHTAKIA